MRLPFFHNHSAENRRCFQVAPPGAPGGAPAPAPGSRTWLELIGQKGKDFFMVIPQSMVSMFENLTVTDMEVAKNLVDPMQWIDAFKQEDIFDVPKEVRDLKGPTDLLLREDSGTRKEIFRDFVMKMIPENVRKEFPALFGADGNDLPIMETRRDEVLRSMEFFLGEQEPTVPYGDPDAAKPEAEQIAKRVIEDRYLRTEMQDVPPYGMKKVRIHTTGLHEDYAKLRQRYGPLTPSALLAPNFLEHQLPPSYIRGAMRMGLLDSDRLTRIKRHFEEHTAEKGARLPAIAEKLRLARCSQEAQTATNFLEGLNGFEKLILFAAAAYMVVKHPKMSAGLAAVYFGRKFFFNDESPINTLGNSVRNMVKGGKNLMENGFGHFGFDRPGTPNEDAATMMSFMHEDVREDLDRAALGFGILARTPLSAIASSFEVTDRGRKGKFTAIEGGSWNRKSTLYDAVQNQVKLHTLDRRQVDAFFLGEGKSKKNRAEVGDALTHVFYMLAILKPENRDRRDVVERAAARLPGERVEYAGTGDYRHIHEVHSYDELEDPTAQQYYHELVLEGWGIACNSGETTLAQKIGQLMSQEARRVGGAPETPLDIFARKKTELEFTPASPSPAGTTLVEFNVELDGDIVRFYEALNTPKAEMPLDEFLQHENDEIYQRYEEWMNDPRGRVHPFE